MNFETNTLITCDALTLLERLSSSAVTLAYIDPPWHTRSNFQINKVEQPDSSDEYVAYLSKVVQQLQRILTDTGSLFVHWSPVSLIDVRLIINQAFGGQPKYEITWCRKQRRPQTDKGLPIDNEFVLAYSKSDKPILNSLFRPLSLEETSKYTQSDAKGPYMCMNLTVPINGPSAQFVWRGYRPSPGQSWRLTLDQLEALDQDNRIYFSSSASLPRMKKYLNEQTGIKTGTTWDDIPDVIPKPESAKYPGEKPIALMERIVQLASNVGDVVLDPFFGGGTTLQAAQLLGRRWLGSDNLEEALQATMARLLSSGLEARRDYALYSQADIIQHTAVDMTYSDVVASVKHIAQLQQDVIALTDRFSSLKERLNIEDEEDEGRVEQAIKELQDEIATFVANRTMSMESCIQEVCSWLLGWEKLDQASQCFLPVAELLFDVFSQTSAQDYSPFILQYCRALENELLTKTVYGLHK